MIHVRIRFSDGTYRHDLPLDDLHAVAENSDALVWLDLESPTEDEIALVGGIFGWEHLTIEDLGHGGQRAKLEQFDGYVYLVMHGLSYEGVPPRLQTPEVDFVIGRNFIASVHRVPLPHITESREVTHRTEACLSRGPDFLLYTLTDLLVDSYFPELDRLDDEIDVLEDLIVTNPTQAVMTRIFEMKRDGVALRKIISPQLEIFTRLPGPGMGVVSDEHQIYFRDVHDHLIRIFEVVDGYRDRMSGLLDAYLSTASNRMNEVMKRLTVIAALFLPISFMTGLLGMNLDKQPLWTDPLFWVLLLAFCLVSLGQWLYFRRRGWT